MINLKTPEEIKIMIEGGHRLKDIVKLLLPKIREGMTTQMINDEAERLIIIYGGEASFKKVKNYYWATCLPINEQIVHTPPSARVVKAGDLLTLDIGFYFKGYHTDYSTTIIIDNQETKEKKDFLEAGKEALYEAIKKAKVGNYLGEVSQVIEKKISLHGFHIIRRLTGHGIGKELHEEPMVPGYVDNDIKETIKVEAGLTLAIEVIYSMGTEEMIYEESGGWSVITKDRSLSACFEHTIAITNENTQILT